MTLNKEELIIGLIFGLCFTPIIGAWSMGLGAITSILWAMTGAGYPKYLRRVVVPALACISVYLVTHNWHIFISLPLAYGVLSIGYGIPDSSDEGSALGRFWTKVCKQHANVLTRTTIYALLLISFLVGILW